jgi:hypothetical protein
MLQNAHEGSPLYPSDMVVNTCEGARIYVSMLCTSQTNIILKPDAYTYFP